VICEKSGIRQFYQSARNVTGASWINVEVLVRSGRARSGNLQGWPQGGVGTLI